MKILAAVPAVLLAACAHNPAPPPAEQPKVLYELDRPAELSGRVEMLVGIGLKQGEEVAVRYPALILDRTITAVHPPGDPENRSETSGIVQIAATGGLYDGIRSAVGGRATVHCSALYPRITAHHYQPLLCSVDRIVGITR